MRNLLFEYQRERFAMKRENQRLRQESDKKDKAIKELTFIIQVSLFG